MEEKENINKEEEYKQKQEDRVFLAFALSCFVFAFSFFIFILHRDNKWIGMIAALAYLGMLIPIPNKYNEDSYSKQLVRRVLIVGWVSVYLIIGVVVLVIVKMLSGGICVSCGIST
ncbi:MAG: hypothetical protein IKZ88_07660 [Neisseriaceae bacterium]|nr:hypothetical protein [Neisseriaceae bacterium]